MICEKCGSKLLSTCECSNIMCDNVINISARCDDNEISTAIKDCNHTKYRVVTFQSKDVIEQIINNKVYKADKELSREKNFNKVDFDNCGGNVPIWVFQHPCFKTTTIGHKQWCVMLETFRCESGLQSLHGMYMIELLLDKQPLIGVAHNACSLACVIPEINMYDVAAIYQVLKTGHWYFHKIIPIEVYVGDVLFKTEVEFNEAGYEADETELVRLESFKSADEYYK